MHLFANKIIVTSASFELMILTRSPYHYFHASYVSDGSTANNLINADVSDVIFGDLGSSAVIDTYNGNMYPDQISPVNGASSIFQYNNSASKISGVRYTNGTYKLVYIGIGMEQVSDVAVRKSIIKRAHDWFYGIVNSVNENNPLFTTRTTHNVYSDL